MESKQQSSTSPVSDPSSGSSLLNSPYSYDDSDVQNLLNDGIKFRNKNGSGSSSSSSSSSSSDGSDDVAFVSGDEEFDTALERPVVGEPEEEYMETIIEGEENGEPSDFSSPQVVDNPVINDDVEKKSEIRVLEGEEVEGGSEEVVLGKEAAAVVGDNSTDSAPVLATDNLVGAEVLEEKPPADQNLNPNSEEMAKEANSDANSGKSGGNFEHSNGDNKVEENSKSYDGLNSMNEEEVNLKVEDEETMEESKLGESSIQTGDSAELTHEITERANSGLIKEDGDDEKSVPDTEGVVDITVNGSLPLANGSHKSEDVVEEEEEAVEADSKEISIPISENDPTELKSKLSGDEKFESEVQDLVKIEENPEIGINKEAESEIENNESAVEITAESKIEKNEPTLEIAAESKIEKNKPRVEVAPESEIEKNEPRVEITLESEIKKNEPKVEISAGSEIEKNEPTVEFEAESEIEKNEPTVEIEAESEIEKNEPMVEIEAESKIEPKESMAEIAAESTETGSTPDQQKGAAEDESKDQTDEEGDIDGSVSDGDTDGMIFGSSEAAKQFMEELEQGSRGGNSQRIDGQIVTDSDEDAETDDDDEEADGKELFDSAALAALLKAATGADSGTGDGGGITITSQDGSRLFSVERPAGLGSSLRALRPTAQQNNRPNIFAPSNLTGADESDSNLSDEEKKKLEKLQAIRVKFLRLVQRLGLSTDESVAAQVLYRLALIAGRQTGQFFSLDSAKRMAYQLEEEGKDDDLDFSLNILVLGKSGVGKSATINSILGEEMAPIAPFEPGTTSVNEMRKTAGGVDIRVFDTPGLRPSLMEQGYNRKVLSAVNKLTKKNPVDIVLYVDRLDAQTRDLNDLPLMRTITGSLGPSIWRSAIVSLTHAASAPPDGPSGSPLSYEVFVTQRSHVVQQSIGQAVGDLRMMSPSLMNPVSLVENHPSCRRNREGERVLPNGQCWRPQLLLLCYSMKILAEASSLSKPQDPFDHRKLFGLRVRAPPLPYLLSSMLQSREHPKLSPEQGGDNVDSDIDLDELSDSDREEEEGEEDEYDQLPPFKPLKKAQLNKLSREQRKAYFEEYDYRVKLLQKKQWREEIKRMREMKKRGINNSDTGVADYGEPEEEDAGAAAPVAVPLPDMVLPPSFDGSSPAYRYRFLEPTSQFLARPVLDTHGWDHDCGYDGVNVEQSLAVAGRFPAAISVQVTKDKKDFSINLDSSVAAKLGENGPSTMAGFDIQNIGKQLAYIVRGETKFKKLKKHKSAAGVSVTFLGENVATGFKIEDQFIMGKQFVLVGSAGTVRSRQDSAYGANFELQRRESDFPIGQVQSTFGLSVIRWRGDLALGFNSLAQFSVGRGSKVAVRAGLNNKMSGQITVKTSSSEHLSLALAAVIPAALAVYRKLFPDVGEKYSIY